MKEEVSKLKEEKQMLMECLICKTLPSREGPVPCCPFVMISSSEPNDCKINIAKGTTDQRVEFSLIRLKMDQKSYKMDRKEQKVEFPKKNTFFADYT